MGKSLISGKSKSAAMFHIAAANGDKEAFQFILDEMGANIKCLHRLVTHHSPLPCVPGKLKRHYSCIAEEPLLPASILKA